VLTVQLGESVTKWYAHVTGILTLLNPLALTSVKVLATTGGLFQEPSSGVASRVFPKFHPGLSAAIAAEAVTGVNAAVHPPCVVEDTDEVVLEVDEILLVDLEVVLVVDGLDVVLVVIGLEVELLDVVFEVVLVVKVVGAEVAVPGTH
jgi:hypothetical protein